MIALVSFPRSGNTFFRNLLFELYGLESSTFHREPHRELDENWSAYPVIKTHLLPEELPAEMQGLKVVYIVRDGRDSLVSLAHHRKDLVEPGTDFYINLLEATLALGNSNFGGWSQNVMLWLPQASVVIKYEDLIVNPIEETERLRQLITLPLPDKARLPSFQDLKFGQPAYGAGISQNKVEDFAIKNFRKGKKGSWREEMPEDIQRLFWDLHRDAMLSMGYKDGQQPPPQVRTHKKVLIEISKILTRDNDGVSRYLIDLLYHLDTFQQLLPDWQIDLLYNEDVKPLSAIALKDLFQPFAKRIVESEQLRPYEKTLLKTKLLIRQVLPQAFYQPLSKLYQSGPFRQILARIRRQQVNASSRQESNATRQLIKQYDLVHVPLPQHMHLVAEIEVPKLVTVHDLTHRIMPDFHTQPNVNLAEQGMKLAEKSNSRYLAISEATASDLAKHYPHTQQKIRVVHEGVSRRFNCSYKDQNFDEFRDKYGLPSSGAYLLSLSTVEPRKNIHHLIKAFIRMKTLHPEVDVHLYICGKKGWLVDELYEQEAAFRGYDIYFTGFVDDLDLPLLYAHARGLCYVSHYEGFGLPILEAMQCGTPVIYGDNSAMPEVAGEGGIGVDSRDQDQLIEAMYQLVSDDELYTRLVTAAWRQANTFSLLKSAFKTLQYYEEVIDKTSKK